MNFLDWLWPPNKQLKALFAAGATFVSALFMFEGDMTEVANLFQPVVVAFFAWLGTLVAPANKG